MENSSKQFAAIASSRRCVNRRHHGKITLVTLIAILGLVVMAGLVGNAGQAVTAKVASQNAADAVAFSSAQWMARGMNAVTATNHLIGEVTGLVVVIEALGGPEMDHGMEFSSPQNTALDGINRGLKGKAPARGGYGASALGNVEKPFIDFLVDRMAPEGEDKKKSKAFATIYDSKIQLKMDLSKWLLAKTVANLGFFVPPPWGYLSAVIAYAAHLYGDAQIVLIGKEWFILEGIEIVVRNPLVKQLKKKLEDPLIPALAAHGDFIAGRLNKDSNSEPQANSGIVNIGVGDSLLHLGKVYDVEAFIYPAATAFRIPIEAEPAPSLAGTTTGDEPEWGKDEIVTLGDADDTLDRIQDNINDSKSEIENRIERLREGLRLLTRLEADINNLSRAEGVTPTERQTFDDEKREIERARTAKQTRLTKLERELQDLKREERELQDTLAALADMPPGTGNLSAKPTHLALEKLKQSEERYTQWVRATYPYVDSFRAPILAQFAEHLKRCEAAKHYEKWTNRYTLTKAWQFRSGYRFTAREGSTDGEWRKEQDSKPLEMYVMVGAYNRQAQANGRRDQKGREKWTEDTVDGRDSAEELFTVIGLTHRNIEPLFSPVIYPVASRSGTTTFAQAIFYNGNEQQPAADGPRLPTQAKLGWDTLNWDPAVAAPEWGHKLATSTAKWPWDIFKKGSTTVSSSKVLLNWQAKLMPVTKTRLEGAMTMPMSLEMNANVAGAYLLFDNMVTH